MIFILNSDIISVFEKKRGRSSQKHDRKQVAKNTT